MTLRFFLCTLLFIYHGASCTNKSLKVKMFLLWYSTYFLFLCWFLSSTAYNVGQCFFTLLPCWVAENLCTTNWDISSSFRSVFLFFSLFFVMHFRVSVCFSVHSRLRERPLHKQDLVIHALPIPAVVLVFFS